MAPAPIHPARAARYVAGLAALAATFVVLSGSTPVRDSAHPAGYQYVSPLPGARYVSPLNNIVIREGRDLDPGTVSQASLSVTGSLSGAHTGRLTLADDGRTLLFEPDRPFAFGERVTVAMERVPQATGAALAPLEFEFSVAASNPVPYQTGPVEDDIAAARAASRSAAPEASAPRATTLADDLPAHYPPVTLLESNHPDPGVVFCTPAKRPSDMNHMMILDNFAMPIYYREAPSRPVDFKKLPDGRLGYFESGKRTVFVMDSNYAVVDSFSAGNGYVADSHDFMVLPNNHALLLIADPQTIDMSVIVPGGDPAATVVGMVLQEVDDQNNVLWQWRSWDHFEITDMNTGCASLTDHRVDYVHGNALDLDTDGNVLTSGRYTNEITKIDRQTGDVMWRFGLNAKNNDFTILNDPYGFSDQHNVRRAPNGHITLFDNHQCIEPKVTRILEYDVDEVNMVATLVREYRHTPDQFAASGGGYQPRLGGAGTIGWGNSSTPPHVTEIHPDNSVAWEIEFWPAPNRTISYRASRFMWHGTAFTTDVDSLDFGPVTVGESAMLPLEVTNNTDQEVTFTSFVTLDDAFSVVDAPPVTVPAGGSVTVQAKFSPGHGGPFRSMLYVRSTRENELIAYPVLVKGLGNTAPDCSGAHASADVLWPANHKLVPVEVLGVTDPDGDPVTVTVTGITQNEPVNGPGDGNTCPDAVIDEGAAQVRAERSAQGGGRVYSIAFDAVDTYGASCSGSVLVFVPHDQGDQPPAPARASAEVASSGSYDRDDALDGTVAGEDFVDATGPCALKNEKARPEAGTVEPAVVPVWTLSLRGFEASGSRAVVEYTLAADGDARLSVFDLTGRRIRTLQEGRATAGPHRLEWNTAGLSPGVYFYRLRAGEASLSRMVRIIR